MKTGDVLEAAIWITGDESPATRTRYEQDVRSSVEEMCAAEGYDHADVVFIEKRPGDDRVPKVPDHVQGSRVRLLVGEAQIIGKRVIDDKGSFIANLDKKDLLRLRQITRNQWAKTHKGQTMSDSECDGYIELYGPDAAIETLRNQHLH